jgi:hypothetical protein
VSHSTYGWASKPDIGVDVAGNAYVVWENYEDGDESIAFTIARQVENGRDRRGE